MQNGELNSWSRRRRSRRAMLRELAGAGLGITGIVTLAGCTTSSATPTAVPASNAPAPTAAPTAPAAPAASPTPAAPQRKLGGAFRLQYGSSDAPHLDVHLSNAAALVNYGPGLSYSQLLSYKFGPGAPVPNFAVAPDLAASFDQPDERTYVFKLRAAKFQNIAPVNGRDVVADDVIKSFERQVALKINASALAGVTKMEATDKSTVKLTLDTPNADFLWSLASNVCKVLPPETWAIKGDLQEGPLIGSGPWLFKGEWQKGQQFTVARNPDFFEKGLPYVDSFSIFHLQDTATMVNALRSGNLEAIGVGITHLDLEPVKKDAPDLKIYDYSPGTTIEFGFKCDTAPFDDKRVRQAINKGLNRKEIYDAIYQGKMVMFTGMYTSEPANTLPAAELEKLYAYDPDGAKKLLQDAGKTNIEADLLVPNYLSGQVVQMSELVQAQMQKIGVKFNVKVMDGTAWIAQVRNSGQFIAFLGAQGGSRPTTAELYDRYYSKSPTLRTNLKDTDLDAMIDKQAAMVKDPTGRAKLLQDIQRRAIDNAGYVNVGAQVTPQAGRGYVKDYNPNGSVNMANDVRVIWIDK